MHRIDVHHDFVPPAYRDAMSRQGIQMVAGAALPEWYAQASLDVMNANGIQAALLSVSAPGVYFGDLEAARTLARQCNEYAAQLCDAPSRQFEPPPACAETLELRHFNFAQMRHYNFALTPKFNFDNSRYVKSKKAYTERF